MKAIVVVIVVIVLAAVAYALLRPKPAPAATSTITVSLALYGRHCADTPGNYTAEVGTACNTKPNCSYVVTPFRGEPGAGSARNCNQVPKEFEVEYICSGNPGDVKKATIPGESRNQTLTLVCP
jgi:hypothetical protein